MKRLYQDSKEKFHWVYAMFFWYLLWFRIVNLGLYALFSVLRMDSFVNKIPEGALLRYCFQIVSCILLLRGKASGIFLFIFAYIVEMAYRYLTTNFTEFDKLHLFDIFVALFIFTCLLSLRKNDVPAWKVLLGK